MRGAPREKKRDCASVQPAKGFSAGFRLVMMCRTPPANDARDEPEPGPVCGACDTHTDIQ
ncbi:hypothetical protein BLA3211_00435 [Burkholderia aenigmatica]|uniref:Uncharacterized protein n=1 Tax=Burkholderia aenigmatica TaxID=2015348 RepID=A0A6J5IM39_9BURK|nr:hypothetical protein BLA3211_00435 [Burkholderia aenigmatica]